MIRMTRDSVAAGDDIDAPHGRTVTVRPVRDPAALTSQLANGYLPKVMGIGHRWDCRLNGTIIATLSKDGTESKVAEVTYQADNNVHFIYHSARY